ncbi:alpha-ribazole phosphatase [Flavobacteriaceae bacterium MHTCC 0001]
MEIYLVRHTTPTIKKGICYGQSDLDLAMSWKDEFITVASNLPFADTATIISSPLKRCALLAQNLGNTIVYDNRLKELNFGDWELKNWNEISEKELTSWMQDFVNVQVPNGESYTQLASRVFSFFEAIKVSKVYKTVVIVTHAGPIRALLSKLLDMPLKDSFKIKINYGDVFHITKENNQFQLKTNINL